MRILHLVAGSKWTGPAAVAIDQVRAQRLAGLEAEIGYALGASLAERLGSEGWSRPLFSARRRPADFLQDVSRIAEAVDREPFDIVHCHTSHDHLAAAALRRGRVALVRTLHHERAIRRGPASLLAFPRTSGWAFANSSIERLWRRLRADGAPGAVWPPAVEALVFRPGERSSQLLSRFGIPGESFVVGTIGKMAPGRGHDAAVRILSRTRNRNIVLLQIGKGESREEIWRLAEQLGVGARNFGTGYQEEILPDLFRLMHAFLFTASGSDQGHRAVLEAMASGVPVVSLPISGVEDYFRAGSPGRICAHEEQAAAALDEISSHSDVREAMAQAAVAEAARHAPENFGREAIDFYRSALEFRKKTAKRNVTVDSRDTA